MEFEVKISEKIPAYLILTPLPQFSGGACFSIFFLKNSNFIGVHSGIHSIT